MQWGDAATWAAMAVSAIFGFLSWQAARSSKKAEASAKGQADRATQAAETAAAAQKQTADASTRVAEVMERGIADAEDKPWQIEHRGGGEYDFHLINTTTATKYRVTISGQAVRDAVGFDSIEREEIDGHESIWLDVVTHAELEDRSIVVRWFPTRQAGGSSFRSSDKPRPPNTQRLQLP